MSDGFGHQNPNLLQRLAMVEQRVRTAELTYGRKPGSVKILPVSKTQSSEAISQLIQAGITDFGESYLQEAQDKIVALSSINLHWHFIGPIQSNKTKPIANLFHWVHSVDREKIAKRLNDQRPVELPPLNICLQINISEEKSKSGFHPLTLREAALNMASFPRLKLRGLMAIPAPGGDFSQQRRAFKTVRDLFVTINDELNDTGVVMDTLSMGMSNDLEAAIAEGSTIVRVGTDIFGPRQSAFG